MVDFTHNIFVGLSFAILYLAGAPFVSLITFPNAFVPPLNLNDIPADVETYTERGLLVRQLNDSGLLKGKLYRVGLNILLRPIILSIDAEEKYFRNRRKKSQHGCFVLYDPIGAHGIMNDGLESLIYSTYCNPSTIIRKFYILRNWKLSYSRNKKDAEIQRYYSIQTWVRQVHSQMLVTGHSGAPKRHAMINICFVILIQLIFTL